MLGKKELTAEYHASRKAFLAKTSKPVKKCKKAVKRVSALSAYEDRMMLKSLGLDV